MTTQEILQKYEKVIQFKGMDGVDYFINKLINRYKKDVDYEIHKSHFYSVVYINSKAMVEEINKIVGNSKNVYIEHNIEHINYNFFIC